MGQNNAGRGALDPWEAHPTLPLGQRPNRSMEKVSLKRKQLKAGYAPRTSKEARAVTRTNLTPFAGIKGPGAKAQGDAPPRGTQKKKRTSNPGTPHAIQIARPEL